MAVTGTGKADTAMKAAFQKVGVSSSNERLEAAALKAIGRHGTDHDALLSSFYDEIRDDAGALWALMDRTEQAKKARNEAAYSLLIEIEERIKAARPKQTVGRKPDRAGGDVQTSAASRSSPKGHDFPARPTAAPRPTTTWYSQPPREPVRETRKPGEVRNTSLKLPPEGKKRRDPDEEARIQDERRMRSKLWSLPLEGGRVLAHFTGLEARQWAARNLVRGHWVMEAAKGVPDTMLMMNAFKGDAWQEVEEIYRRAQETHGAY